MVAELMMPEHEQSIRVLLFAGAKAAVGKSEMLVSIARQQAPVSAGTLLQMIQSQEPRLAAVVSSCRLAVNQQYVGHDHPVGLNDEVALIPPVSGG